MRVVSIPEVLAIIRRVTHRAALHVHACGTVTRACEDCGTLFCVSCSHSPIDDLCEVCGESWREFHSDDDSEGNYFDDGPQDTRGL